MTPTDHAPLIERIGRLSPAQIQQLTPSEPEDREPAALAAVLACTAHGLGPALVECDLAVSDLGHQFHEAPAGMAARDGLYGVLARGWLIETDYLSLTRPLRAVGVTVHPQDGALPAEEVITAVIPDALMARFLALDAVRTGDEATQDAVMEHQVRTGWRYLLAARRWVVHREHSQPVYLHDDSDFLNPLRKTSAADTPRVVA